MNLTVGEVIKYEIWHRSFQKTRKIQKFTILRIDPWSLPFSGASIYGSAYRSSNKIFVPVPISRSQCCGEKNVKMIEFWVSRDLSTNNKLSKTRIYSSISWWGSNKPKDNKVIPDPIDDRKFQEWKGSGKSGILLGITLNPRKCIGEKVRRIPKNVETKW